MDHEGYIFLEADEDRVETRSLAQIEALLPRLLDPAIEFFEIFVRGNGRPEDIPKVSWNLAGTEGMRESSSWPPTGVRSSTLVADSAGTLVANASPDGASCGTDITWEHNPNDLVPSSVPNAFAFLSVLPDEAGIGLRSDVLVFDSRPVAHTVELVGPVTAKARIHSSGPNMDLFLRLLDVSPEGSAVRIGRGQVHLVDATQATTVEVDLGQLGYQLREGHLLRLHISSSDFPEFVPLPGTGENPWGATEVVSTTQSLLVGGADGLSLTVSILKGMLS